MATKTKAARGRVLIAVAVPRDETLDLLEKAAKKAKLPISTYIREAAVAAARGSAPSVAA